MRPSFVLVALSAAVLSACGITIDLDGARVRGSGISATDRRSVGAFDRVEIGGNFDVDVEVGPTRSIVVTGDDNLVPLVETRVQGTTLKIRSTESIGPRAGMTVSVTTPTLEAVSVGGSGSVAVRGVDADGFDAGVHGSAEMSIDGDYGDLTADVSGSGELTMTGTADEVRAGVSGSGEIDLLDVRARTARVHVSGSGDVDVNVTESLDAEVSGSGDVRYAGGPSVRSHVSGSGSVRPASR